MRIAIIDLVTNKPERALYGRLMNANLMSIMPQAVGVWAQELGHQVQLITYTGYESIPDEVDDDIDVLFICAFTQSAYLAYAISNRYRERDVVTVLGGPHARAYPQDARNHFDYVLGFTDKELVRDLLAGASRHPAGGVLLSAGSQPRDLPGVRQRWEFIQQTSRKTRFLRVVPMIGSLGCPYTCSFCVDSTVDYQSLPHDQMREDLRFLQALPSDHTMVAWHDPNFGIRFDDYMETIESVVPPGRLRFVAESSMSVLKEPHLRRMQKNGFVGVLPGIESWYDCSQKSGVSQASGMDKVTRLAEHVNLVMRYIPYVQTNFVLGLDVDAGPEPFELTKRFLDLAPGAFPGYSLFTVFGAAAPLGRELYAANRVLPIPFHLLDNNAAINVRLQNYSLPEFYDRLIDLVRYSFSPRRMARRFMRNQRGTARWLNLARGISSEGRGRYRYHRRVRALMDTDRGFLAYACGESDVLPEFYRQKIRRELGPFWDWLPESVRSDLEAPRSVEAQVWPGVVPA